MSDEEMEAAVTAQFERRGLRVQAMHKRSHYGADLVIGDRRRRIAAVQCREFGGRVPVKAVREMVRSIAACGTSVGVILGTGEIAAECGPLCEIHPVEIWRRVEILRFLAGDLSFSAVGDLVPAPE